MVGYNEWAELVARLGGDPVDCNEREYTADDVYRMVHEIGEMERAHGIYAILELLDDDLARRFVHGVNDHAAWTEAVKQAVKNWRAGVKSAKEHGSDVMRPPPDQFTA